MNRIDFSFLTAIGLCCAAMLLLAGRLDAKTKQGRACPKCLSTETTQRLQCKNVFLAAGQPERTIAHELWECDKKCGKFKATTEGGKLQRKERVK